VKNVALTLLAFAAFAPRAHAESPDASASQAPSETAETRDAHDAVYVELLGNGLLYSVNYDHMFGEHLALRAGFSAWRADGVFDAPNVFVSVPVAAYGLVGDGDHKLELGAGVTPMFALPASGPDAVRARPSVLWLVPSVGYRYAPRHGGVSFRAAVTPLVTLGAVLPMVAVSGGYQF
jgi:hypothetical protein